MRLRLRGMASAIPLGMDTTQKSEPTTYTFRDEHGTVAAFPVHDIIHVLIADDGWIYVLTRDGAEHRFVEETAP